MRILNLVTVDILEVVEAGIEFTFEIGYEPIVDILFIVLTWTGGAEISAFLSAV